VVVLLSRVLEGREVDEEHEDVVGESPMLTERTIGSVVGAVGGMIVVGSIGFMRVGSRGRGSLVVLWC
jgi:hypothetical protein